MLMSSLFQLPTFGGSLLVSHETYFPWELDIFRAWQFWLPIPRLLPLLWLSQL